MDILTKICVVVLALLVLASSVFFISLATEVPNYRFAYEQEVKKNKGLQQQAAEQNLLLRREQLERAELQSTLGDRVADLLREKEDVRNELAAIKLLLGEKQIELAKLGAKLTVLSEGTKSLAAQMALRDTQMAGLRKTLNKKDVALTSLQKAYQEGQREVASLGQLLRAALEREHVMADEIKDLDKRVLDLQAGRSVPGKVTTAFPGAADLPDISGQITVVGDGTVTIDVGSAKGIRKGMTLLIHRGAKPVGYVQIGTVDLETSAGIIVRKVIDPREGDMVVLKENL